MKKMRITVLVLFLVSAAAFGGFRFYEWSKRDVKPPVIHCPKTVCEVSVEDPESELLKGVTAEDDRSGDVSRSLVVEYLSGFDEDNMRTITYAAIDKSGNVARAERKMKYTDYRSPVFSMGGPLRFAKEEIVDLQGAVQAYSELDGDLSGKVQYSMKDIDYIDGPGKYPVEFHVTDSAGYTSYLPMTLEIYDPEKELISVELKQYLVYAKRNSDFDPEKYYDSSSIEGDLEIRSKVDTSKRGVYTVDYIMHGATSQGKRRLVVVVK